jgi:TolB protein
MIFKRWKPFVTAAFLIFVLALFGNARAEDYQFIDLTTPYMKKIPLAVPHFKALGGTTEEEQIAREASEQCAAALSFTGYFELIDRAAYLYDPRENGIITPSINFRNWTLIGAELLITGGVGLGPNELEMEFRFFDTVQGRRLIGKRYRSAPGTQRDMALRFCTEIIQYLTGRDGFFQSKIAFVSTASGSKEIYTCDFDGSNVERLTNHKSISLSPAWSTDSKWIAYTSFAGGKPDLYVRNRLDGRTFAVREKGINISPAWFPGKFALAATMSFSGDQEIYLLTGAGKIVKRITNKYGSDVSPTWSPDGKKIAFNSSRAGSPQIYIMEVDTGGIERLTFQGRYNTQPCWSPLGDKIAYTGMKDNQNNIYVIGLDGKGPVQLTNNSGDNESPAWAPDGSLIAFSSSRKGSSQIYVMTPYGTDQRPLLLHSGKQTQPRWSHNIID